MESYRDWILRAESSFDMAKVRVSENVFYADLCFQAQQAVEKAFKALLIYFQCNPPYTHDIKVLIELLENYTTVDTNIKRAYSLTQYASNTRYPISQGDLPEEAYNDALKIARDCLNWVYAKIPTLAK